MALVSAIAISRVRAVRNDRNPSDETFKTKTSMKLTKAHLITAGLFAGLGAISVVASCYDFTVYTTYSPTPVAACAGQAVNSLCGYYLYSPSVKTCQSGPTKTNATCQNTSTQNVQWWSITGTCQWVQGTFTCVQSSSDGPHTIYNLEMYEAVSDPTCNRS